MSNNQISLKDAIEWTTQWRKDCPKNCKAFLIPVSDLVGVLKEMKILQEQKDGHYIIDEGSKNDIRAYMAVDKQIKAGNGEKIILVGTEKVKEDGKVIYRDIINHQVNDGLGDPVYTGIFDFTEPCPSACDDESPLNGD